MGGQDILRRYLTFFFWVQTWQFGFYRKKRQRERPPVMTIRSSASSYRRGDVLHIILTWASCLAYLCRRQPRPVPRVSKSMTPTLFLYPFGSGGHRTENYNMYNNSTFLRVFVGTVWDIYFLFYRTNNRPLLPSVKDGLKDDLLFFFEKQDYPFPYVSQMVETLSKFIHIPPKYWDCNERDEFVEKFSKQLANSL